MRHSSVSKAVSKRNLWCYSTTEDMRFLYNVCASQKSGHGCTEEATITTKSNVEAAARHVWAADSSIVGMGTQKKNGKGHHKARHSRVEQARLQNHAHILALFPRTVKLKASCWPLIQERDATTVSHHWRTKQTGRVPQVSANTRMSLVNLFAPSC